MPKIPFKRTSTPDPVVLDAYLPSQTVDYTVVPPLEGEDAEVSFGRLPLPVRIVALLLPLVVVIGLVWGLWRFLTPAPAAEVVLPPTVSITSARVVSPDAIMVEAQSQHVSDGTPVRAQLLANDQPVDWLDSSTVTTTVQDGRISLRLQKAPDTEQTLDPQAIYRVDLSVGDGPTLTTAQADLAVPLQLAGSFFVLATPTAVPATPTPEPTPTPEASPTDEPVVAEADDPADGPPMLDVTLDATLLISPTVGSAVTGSMPSGTSVVPLVRSEDNQWLLVRQANDRVGWMNAKYVEQDETTIERIPSVRPDRAKVTAGPLTARVFNGGNIRYAPDKRRGTVLGQLHADQTVSLVAKTKDGQWYKVVAPEAEGWVHVSLLTIPRNVISQVPVAR
jgi:SH3-like domain-containing protein